MIYKYIRYSTNKQDELQQDNKINQYLANLGIKADSQITDEAVSGGVEYDKRNLGKLCNKLLPNDTIVVSELSRLTRGGISELNTIIKTHFAPNKLRLIICNVGLDVNCSNLNPMVELQLAMLATFAKIEKIQIQDRTQSALDARKKQIEEQGFFIAKSGDKRTKLGNGRNAMPEAQQAAAEQRTAKAKSNAQNIFLWKYMAQQDDRKLTAERVDRLVANLNALGATTSTGLPFTPLRFRAMWTKVQSLYMC